MSEEREITNEELEGEPLVIEKVPLGNGVVVYSRDMGGTARDLWEQRTQENVKAWKDKGGYPYFRASLVVLTFCNKDGSLRYTNSLGDIKKLSALGAKRLDALYSAGARLSGVTKEDAEKLGKNSETGQSEDSISS